MVQFNMNPGRTEIELDSALKLFPEPQRATDLPGGLYPLQTRSFELDEYRIKAGWPVAVPRYDIHADSLVSAGGEAFSGRDDNTQIETNALIRWVADDDYYDAVAYTWKPLQNGTAQEAVWTTSADFAPTLVTDYEYRVKDERFTVEALNFDSDTQNHMWLDVSATFGSSHGYSVIMVMSPNSVYGNNVAVPYNGLWCPGRATPAGETFVEAINPTWVSVTMQGRFLYVETQDIPRERVISISQQINTNSPMFLAMVFGRPHTTFYVGSGPESIFVASIETGEGLMDDGVVLGRSTGDIQHTADMALMDLGVYADSLTKQQVRDEFSLLSACYGGSE